jgi:ADP-ribosylglycohydrolase
VYERLAGTLLGTAVGDALGLPAEGMSSARIARRFGPMERYRLLGTTGFVSDDTEQSALVAQSLARHPGDAAACAAAFRRSLLGWFCRLPWGVGLATVRACGRIALGLRPSGVLSAGNGAAMRAAVVGVFFSEDPAARARFGRALAEVTHRDERAVAGALFVADLAAACAGVAPDAPRQALLAVARAGVSEPSLAAALDRAVELAGGGATTLEAARELKTSGFVLHTVPYAACCFLLHGDRPLAALSQAIRSGGDTDSYAAILGAWLGALHGEAGLPGALVDRLHDGPFGPTHLRALARCLAARQAGTPATVPGYSAPAALARNLCLLPVVLAHGFRRLLPL